MISVNSHLNQSPIFFSVNEREFRISNLIRLQNRTQNWWSISFSPAKKTKQSKRTKKKKKYYKNKATDFLTDLFNSQNSRIQLSIEMIYNWITKVSTTERIPWTLWGSCVLIAESCRPLSCLKKNLNPLNLTSSFDKTKAHILWLSMSYYGKLESRVQYTRIAVRGPSNHIINRSIHIQ